MKKIKIKMGLTSAVITAVVIASVILINAAISVVGDKLPMKIDLTRNKIFEFSEQTTDVMQKLDKKVTAYALIPEGSQGEYIDYMKEYLDKYTVLSNNFKVEYIDPYADPTFMYKYTVGDETAEAGSVIIECGENYRVVSFGQIYSYNYSDEVQIDMERKVTNAIMSVSGMLKTSKVYFTSGHNEESVSELKSLLEDEGYECKSIVLSTQKIPDDADVLFSVTPMADFTAEERDALDAFLDRGGKFVLVASVGMQPMERLDGYLAEWGLGVNYDLVYETDESSALVNSYGMPVPIAKIKEHTITEKLLSSESPLAMNMSTSISVAESVNEAVASKLLTTTEQAYGLNISDNSITSKGPLCMAAISEKEESAVLVIGSAEAVMLTEGAYLNSDFVLNAMNYMSGSDEPVSIRAKVISPELMTMTQQQVAIATLILQWVLPILIVLIGLRVWLVRRYK